MKNEITFKVIYKAPALRTYEVFSNLKNIGKINATDYGEYKTFKEDSNRLKERTIYIKFVGKKLSSIRIYVERLNMLRGKSAPLIILHKHINSHPGKIISYLSSLTFNIYIVIKTI